MNLKTIEKTEKLLDIAFRKGRKKANQYPKQRTPFYTIKGKEIAKIDASSEYLIETLSEKAKEFPSINKLPDFYKDLIGFIIDTDKTKKALAKFSATSKILKDLRRKKIVALKEMKFERGNKEKAKKISNEYFGRVSSLIKSLKKEVEIYNNAISKLREMPSIKAEEEVFILAGLPNVGKSTLLSKITDSKPKIASYPFTTQGLNVGTFIKKYLPVQVIDTPGLLDRPLQERNKIELKAISVFQHLKGTIIFVVDPIYKLEEQKNLFKELKKLFSDKGFIVVINKTDIASKEEIKKAKKAFEGNFVILEGQGLNNLKKEII
jgi:nucleolar GTP-binding protein